MTWTKLGDGFADDPMIDALSSDAFRLYVESLVWCNRNGTDGVIPGRMVHRMTSLPDPRPAAEELIAAGLWTTNSVEVTVVGWADGEGSTPASDQPTAAEVEADRKRNRINQQRFNKHGKGDHSMCDPKRFCRSGGGNGNGVTNGVTKRLDERSVSPSLTGSRPDPTVREGRVAPASAFAAGAAPAPAPRLVSPEADESETDYGPAPFLDEDRRSIPWEQLSQRQVAARKEYLRAEGLRRLEGRPCALCGRPACQDWGLGLLTCSTCMEERGEEIGVLYGRAVEAREQEKRQRRQESEALRQAAKGALN